MFLCLGDLASALWWNKKGFQSHRKGQISCWDQHSPVRWSWDQQVPAAAVCVQPGPQRPVHIWKGLQCCWSHCVCDERPGDEAARAADGCPCPQRQWHLLYWWVWQDEWKHKISVAWSHGTADPFHCKGTSHSPPINVDTFKMCRKLVNTFTIRLQLNLFS